MLFILHSFLIWYVFRNPLPRVNVKGNSFAALCSLSERNGRAEAFGGVNEVSGHFLTYFNSY